ncbi:MAG TPA: helix-turn-helix domain-containing protein [Vicinamibacterales bacterium]|nr:helix-turn-helix domain-containing protein [Vicinamibacterales bacterium]
MSPAQTSGMETAEHRSALGQWQTAQRPADPRLRAYVHGYVGSSSALHAPVQERHVPSTEVPLLLNFGAAHQRLDTAGSGEWTARDGVWVVGLHDRHQLTEAVGERHFMVVRFTPMGAHLFLGLPMHLIANQAVDLELIDPALARIVVSRIGVAGSWTDRFAAIELLIAERVADAAIPASIDWAWRRLVAADGRVALGSLAAEMDCSHRTLIARFQTCMGFPPKTLARLLRFNRVVRSLDRLSRTRADEAVSKPYIETRQPEDRRVAVRWADLAAGCGYVDQAHLIRDFREFAGMTPEAFVRHVSFLS